jgi:hypothetical protein
MELIRFALRLEYTFAREHGLFYAGILRAEATAPLKLTHPR